MIPHTGTRPGLSPAIRAGKWWRGHRELAPRCSGTQLDACRNAPGQTRRSLSHVHHTPHTHTNAWICAPRSTYNDPARVSIKSAISVTSVISCGFIVLELIKSVIIVI